MLYIGEDIQNRMNVLGLTADEVADRAFMEREDMNAIINNRVALEEIDEFDMSLICSVLHCKTDFFTNADAKEKDLLSASMNRGFDNEKSMKVKAKIQDFMNDYAFVMDILSEEGIHL